MKHIRRQTINADSALKNNTIRQRLTKALALLPKRQSTRLFLIVSGFIIAAVAAQFVSAALRESEESQPAQPASLVAPITLNKSAAPAVGNKDNGSINPGNVIESQPLFSGLEGSGSIESLLENLFPYAHPPVYLPFTVFSNPAPITILDSPGASVSSVIPVSGLVGSVSSVTLTLTNLNTQRPQNLNFMVVGPAGQKYVFLSDAGGPASATTNATITFADAAASGLTQAGAIPSGTFKPTDFDSSIPFPSGPASPYQHAQPFGSATFNSVFGGQSGANINGNWTLWAYDDAAGGGNSTVNGGWSLDITVAAAAATTTTLASSANPSFTNQAITLTSTTTSSSTVNTGNVNFVDNTTSTTLCSNVPVNGSGVATCLVPANTLTERIHQITATYIGNATFATSNGSIQQEVNNPTQISGTMFTNPGTITIADAGGNSVPYPSNIFVSGLSGTISKVTVTLQNVNFPNTNDIDLLLVGPGGQKYVFWSDAGGGSSLSTGTFVLDDTAGSLLPASGSIAAGTYKPTDNANQADTFPAPAPAGPYSTAGPNGISTLASVFGGAAPNGKWSLYATDDAGSAGVTSSIVGWKLTFTTSGDAPTTTTLTSSPNPSTTSQSILFTATVTSTSTVNAGTVTFRRGATVLCNAVPVNGSGVATCNVSAGTIPQGTHVITADYNGSPGQFNISSGTTTQQVNSPTVVTCLNFANNGGITVSNTTTLGNPYPSNIIVSGLAGAISKVTLTMNIGSALTPDHNDFLLVGPGGQKFLFMGDAGGTNDIINQTITLDDAAASALPNSTAITTGTYQPAAYTGDPDIFPVPAPSGPYNPAAPEGTGTFANIFNGISPNGTWSLYATEDAGDAADTVINNWSLTFTLAAANTTTSVTSSANPSVFGQPVTFTATVSTAGLGTPTGNVQFFDGATPIGSPVALNGSGQAQVTTSTLSVVNHNITAQYAGSSGACTGAFNSSSGTLSGGQQVNPSNTAVVVGSSLNPSFITQDVTFTATVSAQTPSVATVGANGTASFFQNGNPIVGCTNVSLNASGQANCTTTFATAGNRDITVQYSGTANFNASNNNTVPLVQQVLVPPSPNILVRDAKVAEPATGSTNMVFTVALSAASPINVSVDFTTATGVINPGTTGVDYTATTGTVTFISGQQLKTISVPVLADMDSPETDETFLVNLSNAVNGNISDGQATGTITPGSAPGAVLISELRTSGPGGAGDDYVEIYNNSDAPLTVAASDASAGWALVASNNGCIDDPVIVGIIPNGTVIPARGHYLFIGSAYSLSGYGGTGAAAGNQTMTADINSDANVALFTTADPVNLSTVNRLDAVGFGLNTVDVCDLLREGSTLNGATSSTSEHAFVRKYDEGVIVDTNDNASDFLVVTTTPATPVGNNATPSLGAPGPQSLASPLESAPCGMTIGFERDLLDSMVAAGAAENRVRTGTGNSGTLSIRRKFTNNSGSPITRLRFRFYDLTTAPAMVGTADLRSTTSTDTTVTITSGMVTVRGTTLETPPAQANGGGLNSTLSAGAITLGSPLAPGASINAQFLFNVNQAGNYRMGVMIEGLPGLGSQERWILEGNTETQTDTETGCNELPETTIDSSPPNPSNSSSASFSFSGTDADGTVASFECKLDMGAFAACVSPQSYMSLSEGNHTFMVRAIDNLGAVDETPASFTWTIDTIAPNTTIDSNPTNPSNGNVSFTFSGTDAGTGVTSFECKLDAGTFAACTSPQNYPGLTDGSHTFMVRAIDGAGNTDASPASYTWTVDATSPETTINTSPTNPSNSNSAGFTFSSNEIGSTFECKLDAGSFAACTSPQNYTMLAEGSHTFEVRAIDGVGNVDASPASFTWLVDTIAPDTMIDSNPTDPSSSSTASFTFSGTDGGSGVASFECKLDMGSFTACTSPQTYNSLADGSHTFMVRAIDNAGNTDATPASFTWTIDTAPPDTTIDTSPTDPSGANVSFSFSGTDAGTGVASFECKLDMGSFAACTSPQSYTNLAQGSHTFMVRAIDGIGNVDPTPDSFTWTVDATAPDTTINSSPPNPSNSSSASFTFSGTDSGGSTVASFECDLDGGGFSACTSPQNYTGLSDGSHTFQVRAIDGVGNVDASPASYTWTVDSTGPDTTITANPTDPSNSNSASFSFTGTDTGGSGVASFECDLDGGGFTACTSGQTYNSLADGSHTFMVRAVDNAGNVDQSPASFTWTVDTAPPDTTINSNPANPTNSTSASFTFSGTDSGTGVASFECKLDMGSFAACTSPQNYSSLADGSHTFMVRAIDGIGNVDPSPASFTWTVDTDPPDVSINQAAGQSDPANGMGIQIHFTAVFNEPVTGFTNGDVTLGGTAGATTVTVTEIAPMNGTTYDVSVSGMTMGGTVTASIGANKATDAAGNGNTASTSTDNTVTYVPNTPPTAVADSYSTTQDTPLNVAAPGVLSNDSDPDAGNTITAVLVTGPANAQSFTLNANGSFNYNPTPGFTGTDSFTYKARDNFNADSNVVTVTLSVKYRFNWVANGMFGTFTEQGLNQVTAGSNVALRFTLYGYKGDPYSQPPTSEPINCATFAPTGPASVINRFTPDPFYSSLYDFYQTTWQTQLSWKFTCRRLTLHFDDGTTRSLNFYFK